MSEVIRPDTSRDPVLLLDVDGVLVMDKPMEHLEAIDIGGISPYFNLQHTRWLTDLSEMLDIRYLSASVASDDEEWVLESALNLPKFDWIDYRAYWFANRANNGRYAQIYPDDIMQTINWDQRQRQDAIDHFLPNRSIAWVDDLLGSEQGAWADARNQSGLPTLLIRPSSRIGLELRHVKEIENWLAELAIRA